MLAVIVTYSLINCLIQPTFRVGTAADRWQSRADRAAKAEAPEKQVQRKEEHVRTDQ
jgi:hypothetical protein